jgi:hypothetical protein
MVRRHDSYHLASGGVRKTPSGCVECDIDFAEVLPVDWAGPMEGRMGTVWCKSVR